MTGNYHPQDLFGILLRAASWGDSIEHTVCQLQGTPNSNGIRYPLDKDKRPFRDRLWFTHSSCLSHFSFLFPFLNFEF
jgi:hypothetical protein